jgi:hypothetical protein
LSLSVFGADEQEKHAEERQRLLGPAAHPLKPNPLDRLTEQPATQPLASDDMRHGSATAAADELRMTRG